MLMFSSPWPIDLVCAHGWFPSGLLELSSVDQVEVCESSYLRFSPSLSSVPSEFLLLLPQGSATVLSSFLSLNGIGGIWFDLLHMKGNFSLLHL